MNTNKDNIKTIVDKYFEEIEVPIGLEQRISNKIDHLSKKEQGMVMLPKFSKKLIIIRFLSIAAAVILIATATILLIQPRVEEVKIADTCATAEEAYHQTQAAFTYLAAIFEKSITKVNETSKPITESRKTINKYIN